MNRGISFFIFTLTIVPFILMYFWFNEPLDDKFGMIVPINILWLGLLIGFCIYTYKSGRVPKGKQHLWAALLVFGNFFAFPFFWYFYMWKTSAINQNT